MVPKIKEVYLSADYTKTALTSSEADSTDVIIQLENGDKLVASFFTYDFIGDWKVNEEDSDENFHGKYFWAPNMIIVDDCSKENILAIIQHLIDEGDFKDVFKKIN